MRGLVSASSEASSKAHAVSGKAVHDCLAKGRYLQDMPLEEYKELSPLFEKDIYEAISPETCVANRNSLGGTSYSQVGEQLKAAKELLEAERKAQEDLAEKQI